MISCRKAGISDLELLTECRCMFLRALKNPDGNAACPADKETETEIESRRAAIRAYHEKALEEDRVIAFLAYDVEKPVAFGEACLYEVIPGFVNPNGKRAYIMNIYTDPEYRGQGIATKIVDLLVGALRERGVHQVTLNSSVMGKPVYQAYGFKPMSENDMILNI